MAKRGREALAQVPLFSQLSPRYLKRLADSTREVRFAEGTSVVREGERGDSFYVIVEGEAKVLDQTGNIVNRLLPGDFFGEISLLDGGARTATVVCETPMTMLELKRSAFRRVLEEEPRVAVKLLEHGAAMLRRLELPVNG
ncbi:MAG: cyclic nucleotide-binding domain-containing protein [Actinomycetota bacterium]